MVKSFTVLAGVLAVSTVANAAVYNTIQPTNAAFFNQDIVFESGTGTATATFGSRDFFVEGVEASDKSAAIGLVASGAYSVNSGADTINFQLQSYAGNNVSLFTGATSRTFSLPTLASGASYGGFAIASMGQVQADNLTITVNYSDQTTSTSTFTMYNWGQAVGDTAGVAIFNVGRTNGAPGTSANVDTNNVYSAFFNLVSVTSGKTPVSITLPGIAGYDSAYLAVAANVVPEPASMGLLCGGALALMARRRRA